VPCSMFRGCVGRARLTDESMRCDSLGHMHADGQRRAGETSLPQRCLQSHKGRKRHVALHRQSEARVELRAAILMARPVRLPFIEGKVVPCLLDKEGEWRK
jgi:hypothetical protein